MKNIMYIFVVSLLGSGVLHAQSHVRISATGEVNLKGVDVSIQEQVRENVETDINNIDVFSLPAYNHTQLTLSKEFADLFSIGGTGVGVAVGARNANEAGVNTSRLQVDGNAKYSYRGLEISKRTRLQQTVNSADITDVGLGSFALREKTTLGYSQSLYNMNFGFHIGDEVFLSEGGFIENRVLAGVSLTAYENYSLVAEYFLQSEGDLLTPDLKLGTPENGHVVAVNAIISF